MGVTPHSARTLNAPMHAHTGFLACIKVKCIEKKHPVARYNTLSYVGGKVVWRDTLVCDTATLTKTSPPCSTTCCDCGNVECNVHWSTDFVQCWCKRMH